MTRAFPPRLGAALAVATGVLWLFAGWRQGWVLGLFASLPGVSLIACASAFMAFSLRRDELIATLSLLCVVSLVFALVLTPFVGWMSLLLILGAIATFMATGRMGLARIERASGRPAPPDSATLWRKVATDEALLGFFVASARLPRGEALREDLAEVDELARLVARRGWLRTPAALHERPPVPTDFELRDARLPNTRFEWLTFDSGFEPDPALPGAARWQSHAPNRTMAARIFRHRGAPRPWLVCIHGYRMGIDAMDLQLFRAKRLHHKLGLNIAMPILPLHGQRRIARLTGGLFFDGPMADLMHGQAQGLWDLRRLVAWIELQQPGMPIGALGYSLGGYHTALLAAFEPNLACVIAGIPLTDIPAALWRHMPARHRDALAAHGLSQVELSELMAPVSPLHLAPVVAHERRHIFAATADRIVGPDQPLRLWQHWNQPDMHWYHGSHLSVRSETGVLPFVEHALRENGLIDRVDGSAARQPYAG